MRFRTALSLATYFLVCFTLAVWRSPALVGSREKTPRPEIRFGSGTVASVGDEEFALDLDNNEEPRKLRFLIDAETRMEGELAIGAKATVAYRFSDGKSIAAHVMVVPA